MLTAAYIKQNCPAPIKDLGKRIAAHYDKLLKCEGKTEQHRIAIGLLLKQAEEACDAGGFAAFRQRFCPNLAKSRAHELLQIASGRKSVEQVKAATRERVKKHRAVKAAAPKPKPSVTVTDSTSPEDGKNQRARVNELMEDVPDGASKTDKESARWLCEFKYACEHHLPKMNAAHRQEAVDHVASIVAKIDKAAP